ncbi:hypothetical protein ACHAXT_006808 [Thalassiosira profunda]
MIVGSLLSRGAILQSLATSAFLCTSVRNAPQSSPPLTPDEIDSQRRLSSSLVRRAVASHLRADPTLAGPLLRLAFHDAATREKIDAETFTGGPNGSIRYEVGWSENRGISRPLAAVEGIYYDVGDGMGLSFADCVALAGAQAVETAGGPTIPVKLGRKDANVADARERRRALRKDTDRSFVETTLPSAGLDSDGLRLYFGALGLSEKELVALCGAHDLGRHVTLLDMPKSCLKDLTRECLENAPVLMPFVAEEPDGFSNTYYKKLLRWYNRKIELGEAGFIPTDVNLVVDPGLRQYVQQFAGDERDFFATFGVAYQKLVDAGATSDGRY